MAASIDPDGLNGGPLLQTLVTNRSSFFGKLTHTTMLEQLQTRGILWKIYGSPDQNILNGVFSDNVLSYFKNFPGPAVNALPECIRAAVSDRFLADAVSGQPAVGLMDYRLGH